MTVTDASEVYYDPYDTDLRSDPYPAFRRLREEAPLYYNETYDFYAVSRFDARLRRFGVGRRFECSRPDRSDARQHPRGMRDFENVDFFDGDIHRGRPLDDADKRSVQRSSRDATLRGRDAVSGSATEAAPSSDC